MFVRQMLLVLMTLLPILEQADPAGDGNKGGDKGEKTPPADPAKNEPAKVTFTAEQQEHVNALLKAEREDAEGKTKAKLKQEADERERQQREERQRQDQESKGEYEAAKKSLEQERDTAIGERDRLQDENAALTDYFTKQYEAALKDLPDVVKAFAPAEDTSFAEKSSWLTKAQEQAKKLDKPGFRGNGRDPDPTGKKTEIANIVPKGKMF